MNGKKDWIGRRVYFPVRKGAQEQIERKEKGTIIKLTDTGAIIKGLTGGLHNRPWCEIERVREEDLQVNTGFNAENAAEAGVVIV